MWGLNVLNRRLHPLGTPFSHARGRFNASALHTSKRVCLRSAAAAKEAATEVKSPAWSSYVSRRINLDLAIEEAVAGAQRRNDIGSVAEPELAVVFVSSAYAQDYDQVVPQLRKRLPSLKFIFGSTGYGVIGSTREGAEEIEHAPALSVALGVLPGVHLSLTRVDNTNVPDGDAAPAAWSSLLGVPPDSSDSVSFLMLSDPTFGRVEELMAGLDYAFPAANKIGGLTSAGKMSAARGIFSWQEGQAEEQACVLRTGAAVLALSGAVTLQLLVAQGCRPLSPDTYTITRVAPGPTGGVLVLELNPSADGSGPGMTPVEALQRDVKRAFAQQGKAQPDGKADLMSLLSNLTLGVAPGSLRTVESLEPQDFLIRGLVLDKRGFMLVLDTVRVGERVRFMVRDRVGAMEDIHSHGLAYKRRELAAMMAGESPPRAFGMLLFSCNGRGTNLYDEPSFDSRTLASYVPVPCCGFMCNGEIGTVGGSTKLHGFTCAVAVLQESPQAAVAESRSIDTGSAVAEPNADGGAEPSTSGGSSSSQGGSSTPAGPASLEPMESKSSSSSSSGQASPTQEAAADVEGRAGQEET